MSINLLITVLFSVIFNASAQVVLRKAMMGAGPMMVAGGMSSLVNLIANGYLWIGVLMFGMSFILWLSVLANVPVSVAYPVSSLGYVIATVLAFALLGEQVSVARIAGLTIICIGVSVLALSDRHAVVPTKGVAASDKEATIKH